MSTLIFDIETVGEEFEKIDPTTQSVLTRWIEKDSEGDDEYRHAFDDLKAGLGFSPLTGEIVVIGVFDAEKEKGVVYYQAPGKTFDDFEEGGVTFKQMSEKEMLEHFWKGAETYREFVTFNGRVFDAPFLMVRSAIHGIRPTKNLLSNRYVGSQRSDAVHIDLLDQLTFYGAMRRKGQLHLWCRAFGIESPKGNLSGDEVAPYFREGKFQEIAKYNAGDIRATRKLYEYWKKYLSL